MPEAEPWRTLVAEVLRDRNKPQYRSTLAALKKGISSNTETAAYPFVLPWCEDISKTALLRAIALIAEFNDITQADESEKYYSLGRSLALASQKMACTRKTAIDLGKPDAIAQRLRFLSNLDLEEAVLTIRSTLTFVAKTEVHVDWYRLTRLLLRWGKGISTSSQQSRNSVLRDYYRYLLPQGNLNIPEN